MLSTLADGRIDGRFHLRSVHGQGVARVAETEILASVHFNDDAGNSFMPLQLFAAAVPEMEVGTPHPPPPSIPFRLCGATLGRDQTSEWD